jgi:hypothetical protein
MNADPQWSALRRQCGRHCIAAIKELAIGELPLPLNQRHRMWITAAADSFNDV